MNILNEYIAYHNAKTRLNDRLSNVTDDEIALWVSGVDEGHYLNAYTINIHGELKRFNFETRKFINDDNYIRPLITLCFLQDEIEKFQPANRYISRRELIKRWSAPCGDENKSIDFIQDIVKQKRLPEYHPIVGMCETEGKLFRSGLFKLNHAVEIERLYLPALTEPQTETMSNQATKTRKKLKPKERDTTEGLLLVYEILEQYEVEYLDELPATKAWGKIVSNEFTSDLIKTISDSGRSITLKGGEKLTKTCFSEKYRKRF